MATRYAKTRSTSLTTRETQTKPRQDISSHLLGWLLLNRQVMAVGEDVEQREPLYAAGGNVDWCSHYGKQCAGSSRTRKAEPMRPSNPTSGCRLKGENIGISERHGHSQAHRSAVSHSQGAETTQTSTKEERIKKTGIYAQRHLIRPLKIRKPCPW